MRHKVAGYKLGRNTAHRRSLLRNLVTSVIVEERIETTVHRRRTVAGRDHGLAISNQVELGQPLDHDHVALDRVMPGLEMA